MFPQWTWNSLIVLALIRQSLFQKKPQIKKGGKPNSSCVCNLCNLEQVETLIEDDNMIIMAQLVGLLSNLKALNLAVNEILSLIDQD